jgi:hypothetical protein
MLTSNPKIWKWVWIILFVIVGGTGSYFLFTGSYSPQDPQYTNQDTTNTQSTYSWEKDPRRLKLLPIVTNLTLKIDFDNGTILEWTNVTLLEHYTSAFDLTAAKTQIKYKIFQFGASAYFYITTINGKAEIVDQALYWQYFVNESYTSIGANGYQLQDNDVVEWRYGYNSMQ